MSSLHARLNEGSRHTSTPSSRKPPSPLLLTHPRKVEEIWIRICGAVGDKVLFKRGMRLIVGCNSTDEIAQHCLIGPLPQRQVLLRQVGPNAAFYGALR
jgi:hypothetical protein